MSNPPNDCYRKSFNPEADRVLTADGVRITQGMRVWTNNLDHGTVDLSRAEYEWHGPEGRYVLWFDVNVDTTYKGAAVSQRDYLSHDRVAVNHPFTGRKA
ncbi:hypothetical protein ASE48_08495 [Mycobacterium sp. Root265]|uniref:hypothetical protein n=1 Tax=Mycobacterium sp. Root265 TaxID=1736504 RepID=UPI00070DB9D0|nr:hypothetical protein [Mycobacterium sp. Root265]KRD08593.1 hypothetical protein ASE48_08495 [Mycobacterium sp. Root265]